MLDSHEEITLTEGQIELIAERAANKAIEKVYAEIGQSLVRKALYLIGIGALAVMLWLSGKEVP